MSQLCCGPRTLFEMTSAGSPADCAYHFSCMSAKVIWKVETPVASDVRGEDRLQTLSMFLNM